MAKFDFNTSNYAKLFGDKLINQRLLATIVNDDGTASFIPNANIFLAAFGAAIFLWLALIPLLRRRK